MKEHTPEARRTRKRKYRLNRRGRTLLLTLVAVGMGMAATYSYAMSNEPAELAEPKEPELTIESTEAPDEVVEYVFMDGEGHPIDWEAITDTWATKAGIEKRYDLTDAERWLVASVVTAEAQGEPYAGKVAVAQCILQAAEDEAIRPDEAVAKGGYTKNRPEPSAEALEAVQDVFDFGYVVTNEPIRYFYAPALVYSEWHETQDYVLTINGHKFFAKAEK